jgi:hypothetical protein
MIKVENGKTSIDTIGLLQLAMETKAIINAAFKSFEDLNDKELIDKGKEFLTLTIISALATNRANLKNDKFVMPTLQDLDLYKDMAEEIEKAILCMSRAMEEQQGVR